MAIRGMVECMEISLIIEVDLESRLYYFGGKKTCGEEFAL